MLACYGGQGGGEGWIKAIKPGHFHTLQIITLVVGGASGAPREGDRGPHDCRSTRKGEAVVAPARGRPWL